MRITVATVILLLPLAAGTGCKQLSTKDSTSTSNPPPRTTSSKLLDPTRYGGAANFVVNPSFETSLSSWTPWNTNSLLRRSISVARDGHASVRVGPKSLLPYGIQLSGAVGSPARGDAFRLSAWIRSAARPMKVTLILTAYGPGSSYQTVAQHDFDVERRWTRVSVKGRIKGATRNSLTITMAGETSIGADDAFFLDAVSLTGESAS